jgi:hypothetical protein
LKQFIRKADIILFIVLVVTGLAVSAALTLSHSEAGAGAKVIVESGGDLYGQYPLSEDRTLVVPSPKQIAADAPAADSDDASGQYDYHNVVVISGGRVSVTEASCKNQVCVRHGSISRPGESIVCLPNRLIVRIQNGASEEGGGYDSVTS